MPNIKRKIERMVTMKGKGQGRKMMVRISPDALVALQSMKKHFTNFELISMAILHFAEQARFGLYINGADGKGWRPVSEAEAQSKGMQPLYPSRWQESQLQAPKRSPRLV
jgi:hypothetical protein